MLMIERKVKGSIKILLPLGILIYSGMATLFLVLIDDEELNQGEFRQISLYCIEKSNWVTAALMLAYIPDLNTYYNVYFPCFFINLIVIFYGVTTRYSLHDSVRQGLHFDFVDHVLTLFATCLF